jgi:Phospholipase_D-nuclease N-terminal
MVKFQGIFLLISLALTLYTFVDCAMRDDLQLKRFPKWGWLLIIFFLGIFGSVFYLVSGRVGSRAPRLKKNKPRILPPDDDPDFLRGL